MLTVIQCKLRLGEPPVQAGADANCGFPHIQTVVHVAVYPPCIRSAQLSQPDRARHLQVCTVSQHKSDCQCGNPQY